MPFLTCSEQLGAIYGMDAVTKNMCPVILPVEDESRFRRRTTVSSCTWNSCQAQYRWSVTSGVLPIGLMSADSTEIIFLIMETAVAHRKEVHVMKERETRELKASEAEAKRAD